MTSADVEVVRRLFALISGASTAAEVAAEQVWHPDIEYREEPMFPGSGTYRGLPSVTRRFDEYAEIMGSGTEIELEEVHEGSTAIMAVWTGRGRTERGIPFDQRWAWVIAVEDGLVRRFDAYMDLGAARRAAGVAS